MKTVWIVTHNLHGGGCERVISILANRFVNDGLSVMILPEYTSDCFYRLDPRVAVRPLSDKSSMRAKDVLPVYTELRRRVMRERPDVVLAMPEKVNVWAVLFLIGTGVPVAVSERNDPLRHPKSRIKRFLRRLVYPFAAGFIFQTERQAAYFKESIRRRGVVLDNPFEADGLPRPYAGEREKSVVSAGRLEEQKNFSLLVEAFDQFHTAHPDWKLTVYGEGAEREKLQNLVAARGLTGAVSFPGQTKALSARIARAGMFVLSSDYEGMPNALIEAMAQGLPSISTDCPAGGPARLITDGENGLLAPVGDPDTLAAAMARIADGPELAKKLSENAAKVCARLDAAHVAEKWRGYLEGIVIQKNR